MGNKANAATDHVKDNAPLHKLMDQLGTIKDGVEDMKARGVKVDALEKQLGEMGEMVGTATRSIQTLEESTKKLQERCNFLDQHLERGNKVFIHDTPTKDAAMRGFGEHFTQAWKLKRGMKMDDGFMRADQAEGSGDIGGVLIQTDVRPDIVRIPLEASLPRKICLNVPMATLSIKLPVHAGGPKVFWPGEGVEVGVDPYRTSVTFTAPTLTAKTMMAVEELTMELQEDSVVTLAPFFSTVFGDTVSQEENQQLFMSSTPFTGILQNSTTPASGVTAVYLGGSSTSGKTHFSAIQFPDIVNLMYSIHQSLIGRGIFVCNALAFQYLHGMTDLDKRPIFHTAWSNLPGASPYPDQVGGMAGVLMGRPVFLTNTLPGVSAVNTAMVIYGDFNYFAFGDRKQMTVEWSDQVFWAKGGVGIRVRERIGYVMLDARAFAVLKTAAS